MTLSVANCQRTRKINLRLLRQIVNALLEELDIQDAELEINLVTAAKMIRLNEKFLQHAGSTDVIAFDYADKVEQESRLPAGGKKPHKGKMDRRDACPTLSGEIFICVDEALSQAQKFRTSWRSEIVRYFIHGVLHLLGYDDSCPGTRRKMKREENRLLRELSRRFSLARPARRTRLGS